MTGRLLRVGILLSVTLGTVAACGSSDRPKELSFDGAQPCGLLSRADLQSLGVGAKPTPGPNLTAGEEGSGCVYLPRAGGRVDVDEVTNYGVDRWSDDDSEHTKAKDTSRIQGFRVVKVSRTYDSAGPHADCTLYVDVASGQSLKVEVGENAKDGAPTCDTAHRFAEAAMRTLAK